MKTKTKTPTLYGVPLGAWVIRPEHRPAGLTASLYSDAYEALTEPDGPVAGAWADELAEDGYRAITGPLSLPLVLSLVAELPGRAITRLTGRTPDDRARQEVTRALYAPAEL